MISRGCVHKSLVGVKEIVLTILYVFWWVFESGKSLLKEMFGCECWCWWWSKPSEFLCSEPQYFSLPSPLPQWPKGQGFGSGRISLGEIEVAEITRFEKIWRLTIGRGRPKSVTFYRPTEIPDGFFCLGHYCQPTAQPLRGYVLVARDTNAESKVDENNSAPRAPALQKPVNYTLIWSAGSNGSGYIWLPNPPVGYRAMGFVVTDKPGEPDLEEVRCVREDLVDACEPCDLIFTRDSAKHPFQIWKTRPSKRGMFGRAVSVGTFFCRTTNSSSKDKLNVSCLKNNDTTLHAMPNLDQIHALVQHYGPTVFFHPDEIYLPSSVEWFFKNGALLCQNGKEGQHIDCQGSNLPSGGKNDGEFWIDLPSDDARDHLKRGNLKSAELYAHVKPALGGTFTDIAMWVFCPFNGPSTLKVGFVNLKMNKVGEHVSDWEHFTLRISNFTGELWSVYFSQHSGGKWVDVPDLEFIEGNKPVVYASKNGHASFPQPGAYLQGSSKLGIGVRNDAARSDKFVDSSRRYQIIAAEYLGEGVVKEPCWLQFMREWGPTIKYDSRSEIDNIIKLLPVFVRLSVENLVDLFPTELYGEEGPTGPKEKNNWVGDERW